MAKTSTTETATPKARKPRAPKPVAIPANAGDPINTFVDVRGKDIEITREYFNPEFKTNIRALRTVIVSQTVTVQDTELTEPLSRFLAGHYGAQWLNQEPFVPVATGGICPESLAINYKVGDRVMIDGKENILTERTQSGGFFTEIVDNGEPIGADSAQLPAKDIL